MVPTSNLLGQGGRLGQQPLPHHPNQQGLFPRTAFAGHGRSFLSSRGVKVGRSARGFSVTAVAAPAEEVPFTAWGTAIQRVAKRTDLKTIMILGAGPIVIGQVREA
jgi:hypothetical protein